MRIILSPAKQMTVDNDAVAHETLPVFLEQATELAGYMRSLSYAEAKNSGAAMTNWRSRITNASPGWI